MTDKTIKLKYIENHCRRMLALLFNILSSLFFKKMLKCGRDLTCFGRALNKFAIVSWNVPLTNGIVIAEHFWSASVR